MAGIQPVEPPVTSLDDPRVAGYRNLRERDLRAEGLFITEGALLAERLLQSRFPVHSFLVSADCQADFAGSVPPDVPLYVAEAALLREIAGFDFHRGVLGLARRLNFPSVQEQVLSRQPNVPLRLVACPAVETAENLGLILRCAAAFGVDGVLLATNGADPLSRRCLRQSMGASLSLPIATSADLLSDLSGLRESAGIALVAAVAGDHDGVVELSQFTSPPRTALILGNEYHGLDPLWLERCNHLVTIALAPGWDSLNVAVATGIFLHHMRSGQELISE